MPKSPSNPTAGLPMRYGETTLLKRIAKGGMAEIFFAELRGAGRFRRDVIVKRVLPQFSDDAEFTRMLLEEARIAARLNHPNIVQVLNCGEYQGSTYLTLEFVDGVSLRGLLVALDKTKRTLPFDVGLYIALQVLAGLDYAHTQKDRNGQPMHIVHRDVTPENILLGYTGEIKLTDFGVALAAGRTHKTQLGVIKGKVYYLAPEQIHGKPVDHRLDQYVLGLVLYELLSGRRIFAGDGEAQVVNQVLDGAAAMFKRQPELRTALGLAADVVLRAVQFDPRDRFANCYDMAAALNALTTPGLLRDAHNDLAKLLEELFGATHTRDMNERAELQAQAENNEEAAPPAGVSDPGDTDSSRTVAVSATEMLQVEPEAGAPPPAEAPPRAGSLNLANRAGRESSERVDSVDNMADLDELLESASGAAQEEADTRVQRVHLSRDMAMLGGVVAGGLILLVVLFVWLGTRNADVPELPSARPSLNSAVPPTARVPEPPPPRLTPPTPAGNRPTEAHAPNLHAPLKSSPEDRDKARTEDKAHAEERPRTPAPSKARSSLDVACLPWCEITINGQPLRQPSPLRNHKLPPGEYEIKVTNPPSGQSDSRHVVLKAGEHVQIQFRL